MFGDWGMEIEILPADGAAPIRLRIVVIVELPGE
jgi:hypothetical protein